MRLCASASPGEDVLKQVSGANVASVFLLVLLSNRPILCISGWIDASIRPANVNTSPFHPDSWLRTHHLGTAQRRIIPNHFRLWSFPRAKKSEGTGGGEEEGISRALVNCMNRPWYITPINIKAFARLRMLMENLFFLRNFQKKLSCNNKAPSALSAAGRASIRHRHSGAYYSFPARRSILQLS